MSSSIIRDNAKEPIANVLFAHGAGADKSSDFMNAITSHLVTNQVSVIRFNFPYMDKRIEDGKRRPPDRMPKLLQCFIEQINLVDDDLPLFIGGKSMGSRVAATITSNELIDDMPSITKEISGSFAFGYPFHPIGKPENTRLPPLTARSKEILIVQGTRDKLGDEHEIIGYQLEDMCTVNFLADGDHDLKPRVKSGFTHQQHIQTAAQQLVDYIKRVIEHDR
ncbi:hypothetical protein HII17_17220 [Thalassotalea sp. M1531]|uniref:KANL3/Tex30 alpha/beta hydrolase-like domain-containing protein n=1 Tax=Thalassotalea algicola TaxID=2716224 RepID=A0A7Y0LFN9_9GAMM|nr:alpha/beta family hydrolase [Thalassotalea algicola]NMP33297.1 hypothetical protein [Thalassotalea algicola]